MYRLNTASLLFIPILLFQPFLLALSVAADKPVSNKKQTIAGLYLTAKEAYSMRQTLKDQILLIDVRTPEELVFVGSVKDFDKNIPFTLNNYQEWNEEKGRYRQKLNPDFLPQISALIAVKKLTKNSPIILICRSGSRSAKAANLLFLHGYKKVYTVVEGFEGDKQKLGENEGKRVVNGWKNAGLPWSYKLDRERSNLAISHP